MLVIFHIASGARSLTIVELVQQRFTRTEDRIASTVIGKQADRAVSSPAMPVSDSCRGTTA